MYGAIWAYPWDLLEEGPEASLERLAVEGGLGAVSIAVSYHAAMLVSPHNPVRKVRFLEDGAVYFPPDLARWENTPLKPRLASLAAGYDPIRRLANSVRDRGMAWNAWTVCLHNSYLGTAHPDQAVSNAYGDRYLFALCPSRPHVREYARALVGDVASRYAPDAVELEALHFMSVEHGYHHYKAGIPLSGLPGLLLSLCFCDACQARAGAEGLDAGSVRRRVLQYLDDYLATPSANGLDVPADDEETLQRELPEVLPYLRVRERTVTSLLHEVREVCPTRLRFTLLPGSSRRPWLLGLDLPAIASFCDDLVVCAYHTVVEDVSADLGAVQVRVAGRVPLIGGLNACYPFAVGASDLQEKAQAAVRGGAVGLAFYNYGLIGRPSLGWMRAALAEAEAGS